MDKLVLVNLITEEQVVDIGLLFDGSYEYSSSELLDMGMAHFSDNIEIYESLELWAQRLAYAQFDGSGNVVGWNYEDDQYSPMMGEYGSFTQLVG